MKYLKALGGFVANMFSILKPHKFLIEDAPQSVKTNAYLLILTAVILIVMIVVARAMLQGAPFAHNNFAYFCLIVVSIISVIGYLIYCSHYHNRRPDESR